MSSISKSRINVLFLDEVTNVLDEAGKEKNGRDTIRRRKS